ncbi:MAG: hypothetical protein ACFB10_00820 [Salibacteraceae bacterium]
MKHLLIALFTLPMFMAGFDAQSQSTTVTNNAFNYWCYYEIEIHYTENNKCGPIGSTTHIIGPSSTINVPYPDPSVEAEYVEVRSLSSPGRNAVYQIIRCGAAFPAVQFIDDDCQVFVTFTESAPNVLVSIDP